MKLTCLEGEFSVCRAENYSGVNWHAQFCFVGKTDEENSLVCLTGDVPANVTHREDGWKAFRIEGVLDFSLIGILSKISAILAENAIGIFVVSTYNTDYVFIKKESFPQAVSALGKAGYEIA